MHQQATTTGIDTQLLTIFADILELAASEPETMNDANERLWPFRTKRRRPSPTIWRNSLGRGFLRPILSPINMKSVNKVILLGNVTRDAEVKSTAGGKNICMFALATHRVWKDTNGDKQSLPEYHNIVCWGGLADFCGHYVKKGKPLYVEGYLKTHGWRRPRASRKNAPRSSLTRSSCSA